jgi:hypothetical protein
MPVVLPVSLTVFGDSDGTPGIIGMQHIRKGACVDDLHHVGLTREFEDMFHSRASRLHDQFCGLRDFALHRG